MIVLNRRSFLDRLAGVAFAAAMAHPLAKSFVKDEPEDQPTMLASGDFKVGDFIVLVDGHGGPGWSCRVTSVSGNMLTLER